MARATKVWKYNFVYYDPDGFAHIISDSKVGWLKCDTHGGDNWCEHIEDAIKRREDAETLWQIFDEKLCGKEALFVHRVAVPISPVNQLWATVDVHRSPVIPSAMTGELDGPKEIPVYLGFFNRGDGRNAMRSVILDWFMSLGTYPECRDGWHGYQSEMNWQQNMKNSHTKWFEFWATYFHEKCLTCFQRNMHIDFTDLVPDDPKPKYSDGGVIPF